MFKKILSQIDQLIAERKAEFDAVNARRVSQQETDKNELERLMAELKSTNGEDE